LTSRTSRCWTRPRTESTFSGVREARPLRRAWIETERSLRRPGAEVEIAGCRISFSGGNGVWLSEGARGAIRDSDLRRSEYNGAIVSGSGPLEVRGSTLVLNKSAGLAAFHGATLQVDGCTLRDNDAIGVFAKDASSVTARGSIMSWNPPWGRTRRGFLAFRLRQLHILRERQRSDRLPGGSGLTVRRSILVGEGPESSSRAARLNDGGGPVTLEENDVFYFGGSAPGTKPPVGTCRLTPCSWTRHARTFVSIRVPLHPFRRLSRRDGAGWGG
jgi:hypothetical protein